MLTVVLPLTVQGPAAVLQAPSEVHKPSSHNMQWSGKRTFACPKKAQQENSAQGLQIPLYCQVKPQLSLRQHQSCACFISNLLPHATIWRTL